MMCLTLLPRLLTLALRPHLDHPRLQVLSVSSELWQNVTTFWSSVQCSLRIAHIPVDRYWQDLPTIVPWEGRIGNSTPNFLVLLPSGPLSTLRLHSIVFSKGPFPARGLIEALANLLRLGYMLSSTKADVVAFAKEIIH